jgi:hypothetical protein
MKVVLHAPVVQGMGLMTSKVLRLSGAVTSGGNGQVFEVVLVDSNVHAEV